MAKKLNTEILNKFREKMNLSQADLQHFEDEFQSIFEAALMQDKIVKISGLGTFKLVAVEPRKSVDVNTGEEIEIAGHYKLNFTPEAALKEQVNKPLAHLEIVELNETSETGNSTIQEETDPLKKLTEQAEELKSILEDIQGTTQEDENEESVEEVETEEQNKEEEKEKDSVLDVTPIPTTTKIPTITTKPSITTTPVITSIPTTTSTSTASTTPTVTSIPTTTAKVTTTTIPTTTVKNTIKPVAEQKTTVTHTTVTSTKKVINQINTENGKMKNKYTWVWIVIAVILLLAIIGVLLYQYRDAIFSTKEAEPVVVEQTEPKVEIPTIAEGIDTTSAIYSSEFSDIFNMTREYTEFIGTEELTDGSRLAWVSYKEYGDSNFWVYIYEANRDVVEDPNHILIGTRIRIPKLDPRLIDAQNPECIEYARYLHNYYVRGEK